MSFVAGQSWAYRAPEGFEFSRVVIGAIVRYEDRESIVCFSVYHAPRRRMATPDDVVTIPFVPMSESSFAATVTALDQDQVELPEAFATQLHAWANDERGLAVFTVPFLGYLDQMMSMQMSAIADVPEAHQPPMAARG
jgi:hypothetical protein